MQEEIKSGFHAKMSIFFEEIKGIPVTPELLKKTPMLIDATDQTMKKLSNELEKYFKGKKIKTKIFYVLENE